MTVEPEADPATVRVDDLTLERLRAVQRLTASLYEADSPASFYELAVDAVVKVIGADRASLLLFDPDGVMRFKAWRSLSDSYRDAVEGHTPWSPDDHDAVPIFVPDVDQDPELAGLREVFAAEGIRGLAFVPLVHRRRVVGKFMLYYDRLHRPGPAEVALSEIVAAQVALALQRRRVEQATLDSEERFARLIATSPEAYVVIDRDGIITDWNEQAEKTFGWARAEVIGKPLADCLIPPRYRVAHLEGLRRHLATGETSVLGRRLEFDARHRDGREFPVELTVWSVGEGPQRTFNALIHDISDRRRLLDAERAARLTAEDATVRLERLQAVTVALSRVVSVSEAAGVILDVALDELGARTGSLCLLAGDELEIAHARGYPDTVMEQWSRFPLSADLPASEAIRTGRPVFIHSSEERGERYPVFSTGAVVEDEAFAMLPLVVEGRSLGCLVLGFPTPRIFGPAEEAFLSALAGQCAMALWRTEVYDERERARQASERVRRRMTFLAEASAALAASLDYRATLPAVAELAVPVIADCCAIHLMTDHRLEAVAVVHRDPQATELARELLRRYPVSRSDPAGAGAVVRSGTTEVLRPIPAELLAGAARDAGHLEQLRRLDLGAAVAVPLRARGSVVGALTLVNGRRRPLDDDTISLAETLAEQAATAVDNARLFAQRTSIARTLQASLLPPDLPDIPGVRLAACYRAGGDGVDVGGDFYDVFALDPDEYLAVMGDVCGRGAAAAALAGLTRHAVRSVAVSQRSPAAILGHVNEVLLRHADPEGFDATFCTAMLAAVRPRSDGTVAVRLALGGHPLPLLRQPDGAVRPVGLPGSLLGVTDKLATDEDELVLEPGSVLVCYTDGVTERRARSDLFGDGRLAAVITAAGPEPEWLVEALETAVRSFSPDPLTDDVAVLALGCPLQPGAART